MIREHNGMNDNELLDLNHQPVPKMIGLIRVTWAHNTFIVIFVQVYNLFLILRIML